VAGAPPRPRFVVRWDDAGAGAWRIWDTARAAWVDGPQFEQECLGLPADPRRTGWGPRFPPISFPHARRLARRMNGHPPSDHRPDEPG
jgi:hypothetical protein